MPGGKMKTIIRVTGCIYSAMAVPKGHDGRLAYINEFIEEAKASGLVDRMIKTLALQGVRAAPPG
jgi:hypothetical protein